jgi:hypothetical protein
MWMFFCTLALAQEPAPAPTGIVITKVADIYPVLPPPGAKSWDPKPLIDAIKVSPTVFTPKDVYELVDRKVRADVIQPVAAKAGLFYDPTARPAISDQQIAARAPAMKQTVTYADGQFVQLFEFFVDRKNDLAAAETRVGPLEPQKGTESQSIFERRARSHQEQVVKAKGPPEGRIQNTTFVVTLAATVSERDGCSRAVAVWDGAAVSLDVFRLGMGTTKASTALVQLTNSPTVEKAQFTLENPRRFEILGRCGTTGKQGRVTMSRTPEGVWSGTASL